MTAVIRYLKAPVVRCELMLSSAAGRLTGTSHLSKCKVTVSAEQVFPQPDQKIPEPVKGSCEQVAGGDGTRGTLHIML